MSEPVTVAVVQMASVPTDSRATAAKAADRLREAVAKGVKLVVFQEVAVNAA